MPSIDMVIVLCILVQWFNVRQKHLTVTNFFGLPFLTILKTYLEN